MKLYKTKEFARLARKGNVRDEDLRRAVLRAESGLIDANLGAHLIKQRIARTGEGRSGGFRAIIFFKQRERAIFLHLFEKSSRANLTPLEQEAYKDFARILAALDDRALSLLAERRGWVKIDDEHQ
jgi:hypothetical protein